MTALGSPIGPSFYFLPLRSTAVRLFDTNVSEVKKPSTMNLKIPENAPLDESGLLAGILRVLLSVLSHN